MSGGSYDYIYSKIEDICLYKGQRGITERIWFQQLLKLVAEAMHDIEWVDSGDYGEGDEIKAIMECYKFTKKTNPQSK